MVSRLLKSWATPEANWPTASMRRDHGIDDCFIGCLHSGQEQGIEVPVRDQGDVAKPLGGNCVRVGSGKGDEKIARTISGIAAISADSQRNPACQPLQLGGNQRGVGGHYYDD